MGEAWEAHPDLRYLRYTPAGADYVNQITAGEADRGTRAAFRELVLRLVPPGVRLFDFGAGPGLDARYFAELGFTVDAYDVDPRMAEFFTAHCGDLIAGGRINLSGGGYRQFLTREAPYRGDLAQLVLANFAPLNLVDDLRELFVKFAALSAPRARVVASVLNPAYLPEMRGRAWWRGALRLWRAGESFVPGPQAPHYRRLLRHFRAVSAPGFQLAHVLPDAWLRRARSRYLFLVFDKAS